MRKLLFIISILLSLRQARCQTYYEIPPPYGTKYIAGRNIVVAGLPNPAYSPVAYTCYIGNNGPWYFTNMYQYIANGNSGSYGYKFAFQQPVSRLRIAFIWGGAGHTVRFWINGGQYIVTSANISPYTLQGVFCDTVKSVTTALNGDMYVSSTPNPFSFSGSNGQVDIDPGYLIDSFRFQDMQPVSSGSSINARVYFSIDTFAYALTADTVFCPGDVFPLSFKVSAKFNSSNVFTAQLSNSSGSFASPVPIGSLTSDTAGTISCTIPLNTPAGNGYRIRIVSSNITTTSAPTTMDIHIKPRPQGLLAGANTPLCAGATLSLSAAASPSSGITYQWTGPASYSSNAQSPSIANSTTAMSGDYMVTAALNGCYDMDTVTVQVRPMPAAVTAASNTPICAGQTLNLSASTATTGVTYSWAGPASYSSSAQNPSISNTSTSMSGDYIVTATLNGCSVRDTETVTVKPLPATPNASSNTPLCAGSNLNLTASTTTSGVSWNWTGPGSFSSTAQNPTRTNVTTADAGNYIVSAIVNGCASKDTEAVVINPIPPAPSAGSNSPLCSGNTLTLTASPLSGATYSWTGPGGFGAATQNASRNNVQVTDAGAYNVTATANGCTSPAGTVNVTITPGPTVNIYVNPNDTVCAGTPVTLVALPLNGGTTPQIKWYRNGTLTSITTTTYVVAAPVNNDVFYCELTNNTTCAVSATANSNSLTMTVLPVTPPGVTVSPTFTTPQDPYNLLTFVATGTNGGSNPQYQWTHNHQLVTGATGSTWSTQGLYLSQFDTICVIMTSSEICAVPKTDTACTAVQILLGVEDANKNNIEVYPNPNDGRFTINATGIRSSEVCIELYNAVGQLVHRQAAEVRQGRVHETIDLGIASAGMYMLRMKGEGVSYQTSIIKR